MTYHINFAQHTHSCACYAYIWFYMLLGKHIQCNIQYVPIIKGKQWTNVKMVMKGDGGWVMQTIIQMFTPLPTLNNLKLWHANRQPIKLRYSKSPVHKEISDNKDAEAT